MSLSTLLIKQSSTTDISLKVSDKPSSFRNESEREQILFFLGNIFEVFLYDV